MHGMWLQKRPNQAFFFLPFTFKGKKCVEWPTNFFFTFQIHFMMQLVNFISIFIVPLFLKVYIGIPHQSSQALASHLIGSPNSWLNKETFKQMFRINIQRFVFYSKVWRSTSATQKGSSAWPYKRKGIRK